MDLPLHTILFTMQHILGSQGAHQASHSHILYSIEEMAPTYFNWVEALLFTLKEQLTKCWLGELKQFGYGTILVSLFFKRVPHLRPQVAFIDLREQEPCMMCWVEIMTRHGGEGSMVKYKTAFFRWSDDQLLMIEDYVYVGTNFRGDLDMALLEDAQWGDMGE